MRNRTRRLVSRRRFLTASGAAFALPRFSAAHAANNRRAATAPSTPTSDLGPRALERSLEIDQIETPALLLDLDAFERNLERMAVHAKARGIGLRPHGKTHKCPVIARRQMEKGAIGVCAAKVSEAEVFVAAGIQSVLITSPVATPEKIRRVIALAERSAELLIVIDNQRNARDFAAAASSAGIRLQVLVGLDTGTRRTGIALGQPALRLVEAIGKLPSLDLRGLQAYAGHVMHVAGHEERKRRSIAALQACLETRAAIEQAGHEIGIFTGGGTGTFDIDSEIEGVTDLQVGSYVFMDVQYRQIGDRNSELFDYFEPALFVLATAISQPVQEAITVDAGGKAFAYEPSSKPEFRDLEGLIYHYGGDEHGIVQFTSDKRPLRVGDKAMLIVSHCDPTVNLYDVIYPFRGGRVRELWPIAARGFSQ